MSNSEDPRGSRILVVKLSSLGDLFHALPAVHNLKVALGGDIDWVVQEEYLSVVRCFTDVTRAIPMSRRRFLRNACAFLRDLRADDYDRVVDLQGLLKSALVARLARARRRIGPSFHREGAKVFYNSTAGARDKGRHAVLENLDVISHVGLPQLPLEFPVKFPLVKLAEASPRIAVAPLSRWQAKNWPAERFTEVAAHLQREHAATIYLLGAPRDERACADIAVRLPGRTVNLAGRINLVELGGTLQEMDLLLCNDSGPMHMAAALGVPTLALFGPTDPERTGPYGGGLHRVITAKVACRPCYGRRCRQPEFACMTGIACGDVLAAAEAMLGEAGRSKQGHELENASVNPTD